MTEWFEQWFGEEYLRLYPNRDDEDARQAVALIARTVPVAGSRVLDLGCGPGRHAAQLALLGARVVGFDLSMPLIARAKQRLLFPQLLVRGDMRALPFRDGSFDLVVNLFTSFGYFADDTQHASVLSASAAALRPGAYFVLDYFHAGAVRQDLVPREEQLIGSQHVVIERRISADNRFVIKEMHLTGDGRSFLERVRLLAPADLERLLADAGLTVRHRFGAYDGRPLTDRGPRAIFVAQRN
ncbi:MAG: class I SAM-dependent methyltransferase [Gemmatimonadetes bacterium]|nr:class I SAM-dependent methyltransferase [Gemmatimonadota bacterium]